MILVAPASGQNDQGTVDRAMTIAVSYFLSGMWIAADNLKWQGHGGIA
jgi:hypothetical protein